MMVRMTSTGWHLTRCAELDLLRVSSMLMCPCR